MSPRAHALAVALPDQAVDHQPASARPTDPPSGDLGPGLAYPVEHVLENSSQPGIDSSLATRCSRYRASAAETSSFCVG